MIGPLLDALTPVQAACVFPSFLVVLVVFLSMV